jgi:hypothetical protein
MKTYRIHLILAALAATGLNAQDAKPPHDRRPPPPPLLLLRALDADKDGELSEKEIQASSTALLELDKNGDGALTKKEIAPPPPKGKKPKGPPAPKGSPFLVKALDLDDDHVLSADEIEDAPASLTVLDTNGDGIVSKKEMKPGKPPVGEPI